MRMGMAYFTDPGLIFSTVPIFLRRMDTALRNIGQPPLPLDHPIFKFSSWMGALTHVLCAPCLVWRSQQ